MSVAHLLTVLENDEFIERIQKRPEAFIGTTGLVGLENLLVQTINGLLEFFIEKNQGKIAIQLSRQQISFQVSSTRPLVFEQKQVDLEPPFLYLSVLQAFSKQVGISIDQEKQRTIFIYHQGQLKKRLLLPIEETQERIEVLFWPDTQIFGTESLSYMRVLQQCQQIAMLNPGLKILLTQEEEQKNLCYYPKGLSNYLFEKDNPLTRKAAPIIQAKQTELALVQFILSKNHAPQVQKTFVNGHYPSLGGTHYEGFLDGVVAAFNQFLEEQHYSLSVTADSFLAEFDFVLAITIPKPRYTDATKTILRNTELYEVVKEVVFDELQHYFQRHPKWLEQGRSERNE